MVFVHLNQKCGVPVVAVTVCWPLYTLCKLSYSKCIQNKLKYIDLSVMRDNNSSPFYVLLFRIVEGPSHEYTQPNTQIYTHTLKTNLDYAKFSLM